MGLIKAFINSGKSTLSNQYKDLILCDTLDNSTLVKRGMRKEDAYSTNKGEQNIITDGSVVVVGSGQCALIVEQGKVVDFCAEPGSFIWDTKASPSILNNGMEGLKGAFDTVIKRFTAGGASMVDQRVYYVNTKVITGNKFGKGSIPFRDSEFGFTMTLGVFGQYDYQILNPVFFFENYVGFTDKDFDVSDMDEPFRMAVIQSVGPAFARLSASKVTYDQIEADINNLTLAMQTELKTEWETIRGVTVVALKVSTSVDDESKAKMDKFQEARILSNTGMAAGRMTAATADALGAAASNKNGALMGFMGMGMAMNSGGAQATNLHAMNAQSTTQIAAGTPKSTQVNNAPSQMTWACECETENSGKFCGGCGKTKPVQDLKPSWQCTCSAINTANFCGECGNKKPIVLDSKCEKCGFEGQTTFKFCPDCGSENKE